MKAAKQRNTVQLSAEVQALLDRTRPTKEVLEELRREQVDLDQDPEFVADFLKAHFVELIYRAMHEKGMNKSDLAQKLGESRQYVGKILNERANFTLETLAKISCALGKKLEITMLDADEIVFVQRRVERSFEIAKLDRGQYWPETREVNLGEVAHAQNLAA